MKLRPARFLVSILIALVIMEMLFGQSDHPVFPWHHIPGLHGAFGLVSCIALVLVSKALGSLGLQVPEENDDQT